MTKPVELVWMPDLRIQQLPGLAVMGRKVPVPNGAEAAYALDFEGRAWVRKPVYLLGYNGLLAEALGWLLARYLEISVPDAAVVEPNQM